MANVVVTNLLNTGKRMERASECPEVLYEFMLTCWQDAPEDRPSFKEVKAKMEFFKSEFSQQKRINNSTKAPFLGNLQRMGNE
ncbi:hypothetical protein SK128_015700, partial [Halocaridina rubra]